MKVTGVNCSKILVVGKAKILINFCEVNMQDFKRMQKVKPKKKIKYVGNEFSQKDDRVHKCI